MEGFKIGEVVRTDKGYEKIVAIEWGNPVTMAVPAAESVVQNFRPATPEVAGVRRNSPEDLARLGTMATSQLIKV